MGKIFFKTGGLGFGGVERVQIEFINYLEQNPNYECLFVAENDFGAGNVMAPNNIKTLFLKSPELQAELVQARQAKNESLLHKINYNLVMMKERRITKQSFNVAVKNFRPDIAINFQTDYGWHFKNLQNAKNIAWLHGPIAGRSARYLKFLASYDKIVCVSKGIMQEAIEASAVPTDKITYLYNPQDFDRIKLLANEEFSEDERRLASAKFILMVSRVDIVNKDFETLLDAFTIAKEQGYSGKLYIIGEGIKSSNKQLLDWINLAKYKDDIKWLGAKLNPFKWMQACDKFVLSTRLEGLPTVVLEALAVNNTVISSNCHWGPSEILEKDEYGYLSPVGDATRLGELMLKASPKPREKIDKWLEQFSKQQVLLRFEQILSE